ncbi:MAG TPA: PCRF domain-containing protein, partial [Methylophilaceae bacterium]|nr:PCRF domain-containing protein [Methylophilaceae bacterium]
MKPTIQKKLAHLSERLEELNLLLSSESATADMENYRKLSREHAELGPIVEQYHAYKQIEADIAAAQEMAADPDMREFAQEEIEVGKEKLEA